MKMPFGTFILLLLHLIASSLLAKASSVQRAISGTQVTLAATPSATVSAYAVEESLPAGLTASQVSEGGQWDAANRKVKWGPWFDSSARILTYTVSGMGVLSGLGSFDGVSVTTSGDTQVGSGTVASTVRRTISGTQVTLAATPSATVSAYAVEEILPAGLTASQVSEGGQWDAANRKVKWGPWFDSSARTLTYTVSGAGALSGLGSFDGVSVTTSGDTQVGGAVQVITLGRNGFYSNGQFQVTLTAASNTIVILQASTDLENWSDIAQLTLTEHGQAIFTDPEAGQFLCRFYRVKK